MMDSELSESLFEGMTLFTSSAVDVPPPPPSPSPPPPPELQPQTQSGPLDEDLFSDLTLQVPALPSPSPESPSGGSSSSSSNRVLRQQVSRKKKRAVRVGYAREAVSLSLDDEQPRLMPSFSSSAAAAAASQSLPPLSASSSFSSVSEAITSTDDVPVLALNNSDDSSAAAPPPNSNPPETIQKEEPELESESSAHNVNNKEEEGESDKGGISEKLRLLRDKISGQVESGRERAASVMAKRNELAGKLRKVREEVKEASERYMKLESELEEACENEDFERAERISDSLASVERDKNQLLLDLKAAELDYDTLDSEMHRLLEMHLAAHEQAVSLLQQFAKDANDFAESVRKNAEEKGRKEVEEWEAWMESVQIKKMETDVECELIVEAESGLQSKIDALVEDERREKDLLSSKRDALAKDLADLLEQVSLKEHEIALNDAHMHDIDKRISDVASGFDETQRSINTKLATLQAEQSKLQSETESLAIRKKQIDDSIHLSQERRSKVAEIARFCSDEGDKCKDLLQLERNSAASIFKCMQDRIRFANLEESISQDVQSLRQQVAHARETLQELSSRRGCIEEEIALVKQRTSYILKRVPELEAEKKVAAAGRNFKEAGRIAGEAKALNAEKDQHLMRGEKAAADLVKVEDEMRETGERIEEWERLILVKEKEGAMASFERLRLVASAARAESEAALQAGDGEEGEILLREAQDAESKATHLYQTYHLQHPPPDQRIEIQIKSAASIINSSAHHLAHLAASLTLP